MRGVILKARQAWSKPFKLNDLPKAGRMDVVARSIIASLFVSYAMRQDVELYVVLEGPGKGPLTLFFKSWELKGLYPSERAVAGVINKAVQITQGKVMPGLQVFRKSFNALIKELLDQGKNIYYLVERGKDIRKVKLKGDAYFIVGDHKGLDKKTEKWLAKLGIKEISLGKVSYLASQAITILHYELDRREYG